LIFRIHTSYCIINSSLSNHTCHQFIELLSSTVKTSYISCYRMGFWSNRILNSLTQALRSSGVDLAQTSITVQIDVGKRENGTIAVATSSKVYFYDPKLIIAIPIWFHDCWTKLANLLMISEQRFAMEPLPPLLFF